MIIHDIKQGTPEWLALRLGKVTGTGFRKAMSKGKERKEYMNKVCREIITGEYVPMEMNEYMLWGSEQESFARQAYIDATGNEVQEVGFIEYNKFIGVSPDGLVGTDGMIEIKCPTTKTHSKNLTLKSCPSFYKAQVQGQMWVADRQWSDFVSYDPRHNEFPLHIVRVERDNDYIERISQATELFIDELLDMVTETDKNIYQEITMPTINDLKDSKFLKKEDVDGGVDVTIVGYKQLNVALESQAPENKWCLEFKELDKPLVLNQTNGLSISAIVGSEDFDDCTDKKVQLYNEANVMYAGKRVGGIRVKPASGDDGVPF